MKATASADLEAVARAGGLKASEVKDLAIDVGTAVLARLIRPDVAGVPLPGSVRVGASVESALAVLELGARVIARPEAHEAYLWATPAAPSSIGVTLPFAPEGEAGVSVSVHRLGVQVAAGVLREGGPLPESLERARSYFQPASWDLAIRSALRAEAGMRGTDSIASRGRLFPLRLSEHGRV